MAVMRWPDCGQRRLIGRLKRSVALAMVLATAIPVTPSASWAEEAPPSQLNVADEQLILNGYGEREHWWTEVYRCALYLPRRSTSTAYITDAGTAKALQIHILYSDIPDSMPADWRALFGEELSRELFGKLKGAYADLRQNDRLIFAYSPSRGTRIFVNENLILTDPGHGLIEALLDQWIGPRPVSKNLRRLLLAARDDES